MKAFPHWTARAGLFEFWRFCRLSSLERLDIGLSEVAAANTQIANSALSTLPADLFQGLSSLNALAIRGFPSLSQLPAGLFRNLSQLNLLALSHNGLSSLPEGVFDGLSLLSSLDLGNNNLASLPPRLFWDLSTLDTLKLQSNSFDALPAVALGDLPELTGLQLEDNPGGSFPVPSELVRMGIGTSSPATVQVRLPPYAVNSLGNRDVTVLVSSGSGTLQLASGEGTQKPLS